MFTRDERVQAIKFQDAIGETVLARFGSSAGFQLCAKRHKYNLSVLAHMPVWRNLSHRRRLSLAWIIAEWEAPREPMEGDDPEGY